MEYVIYNDKEIPYVLTRKNVKNINIRIKPNQVVYVSANNGVSVGKIVSLIEKRAEYILSCFAKFAELEKYSPSPKQYISGESYKLLGRDLRLKVVLSEQERIESDGVFLYLYIKNVTSFSRKKEIVDRWIDNQCVVTYNQVSIEIFNLFKKHGVSYPQIKIKDMISRWGSCQPKRAIITLNKRLIEAPRNCIEYVILHEYAHFIHPNHSKKFYSFVQMLMPDYKERKRILESNEYYLSDLENLFVFNGAKPS